MAVPLYNLSNIASVHHKLRLVSAGFELGPLAVRLMLRSPDVFYLPLQDVVEARVATLDCGQREQLNAVYCRIWQRLIKHNSLSTS